MIQLRISDRQHVPLRLASLKARSVREGNPCHEPAGSSAGGQFADKGSGNCGPSTATKDPYGEPTHQRERRISPTSKYNAAAAERVFGRPMTKAQVEAVVVGMFSDVKYPIMVNYNLEKWGSASTSVWVGATPLGNEHYGAFNVERALFRQEGRLVAKHISFDKSDKIPAGFGKDIMRGHMKVYEKIGVDEVELFANVTAGPYVWARMGFLPNSSDGYAFLERAFDEARGRTISERDPITGKPTGKTLHFDAEAERLIMSLMRRTDPKSMWRVAEAKIGDFKIGKALMIETATISEEGYHASIKLKNKEQMDKFWSYVGRKG